MKLLRLCRPIRTTDWSRVCFRRWQASDRQISARNKPAASNRAKWIGYAQINAFESFCWKPLVSWNLKLKRKVVIGDWYEGWLEAVRIAKIHWKKRGETTNQKMFWKCSEWGLSDIRCSLYFGSSLTRWHIMSKRLTEVALGGELIPSTNAAPLFGLSFHLRFGCGWQ